MISFAASVRALSPGGRGTSITGTTDMNTGARLADFKTATDVVRQWFLTVAYELNLPVEIISLGISNILDTGPYGGTPKLGEFRRNSDQFSIILYVYPTIKAGEYVFTLAHEMRHVWQHYYQQPPTEEDCDEWANRNPHGPRAGTYEGWITNGVAPCSRCGAPVISRGTWNICTECAEKVRREQQQAAYDKAERDWQRREEAREKLRSTVKSVANWPRRAMEQRRKRRREAVERHRRIYIDNNLDNGKFGWWLVDETFYVRANSAGEAITRVADTLNTDAPQVRYLGDQGPTPL